MRAEIVGVGTELLLGQITDTHSATMSRILAECGVECQYRHTVGDNLNRVVELFKRVLDRSDILITIGGLGPTEDDLTRDAIALALDDTLEVVPEVEAKLKAFFKMRGIDWVESNARQATKPTCAELIDNPNGTAPGLFCQKNGKVVFALPGPKGEFDPMAFDQVKPILERIGGGSVIHSRVLRVIGIGESKVEEMLKDVMSATNPTIAPYAQPMEMHLRITAKAASVKEANELIDPMEAKVRSILGPAVYGLNNTTLEEAVIFMLIEQGRSVATAESMTGGGLATRFTSVVGSSGAFLGSFVTYTVDTKVRLLGLESVEDELRKHGPVSAFAAEQMALAARDRVGSDYAVSITGNAGPTSDVDDKPVGLTYIGIADADGVVVSEHKFRGIRSDIRLRAEQTALRLLRERLLN
ncbi:MAG TPA: competence/damage-inducible protein A [Fimbriimonas sp.]|nr:competence/damage-inducible protein A [Fimbriimonas sp.]